MIFNLCCTFHEQEDLDESLLDEDTITEEPAPAENGQEEPADVIDNKEVGNRSCKTNFHYFLSRFYKQFKIGICPQYLINIWNLNLLL